MERVTWTPRRTRDGTWTLVHGGHGEACHASQGAWTEARGRYAEACRLGERARAGDLPEPGVLRLLDVGTGLGWNLAAALEALAGTGVVLRACALERDPTVRGRAAALAREDGGRAPGPWRRVLGALVTAEGDGEPQPLPGDGAAPAPSGSVALWIGDAARILPALPPEEHFDAVFLDPFSPRVEPGLWTEEFLGEVARRMAPGALLSTYSAATAVRVALARAGLGVRRGGAVAKKAEGTVAGPGLVAPPEDADLVRRIARRLAGSPPERPGRPGTTPRARPEPPSRAGNRAPGAEGPPPIA